MNLRDLQRAQADQPQNMVYMDMADQNMQPLHAVQAAAQAVQTASGVKAQNILPMSLLQGNTGGI